MNGKNRELSCKRTVLFIPLLLPVVTFFYQSLIHPPLYGRAVIYNSSIHPRRLRWYRLFLGVSMWINQLYKSREKTIRSISFKYPLPYKKVVGFYTYHIRIIIQFYIIVTVITTPFSYLNVYSFSYSSNDNSV